MYQKYQDAPISDEEVETENHIFCDASEEAFTAVAGMPVLCETQKQGIYFI